MRLPSYTLNSERKNKTLDFGSQTGESNEAQRDTTLACIHKRQRRKEKGTLS
tara:strand:- start:7565 stop:7720 length:156 start_codon:yes stop_codon:yes gene_type:complete